jgi:hypothetical protein
LLENLAEVCALRNDKAQSSILKQLIKAEDIKAMYAKLRAIRKNQTRQGIAKLEVPVNPDDDPKTCRNWRTVDLPEEILALLRGGKETRPTSDNPFHSRHLATRL